MVEPGIVEGMGEFVTMAVLSVHRDAYEYQRLQARGEWKVLPVRPAGATRVGVLGAGVLGRHVLGRLSAFGFPCAAWSRTRPALEGVEGFAGPGELPAFLARSDVLVCLLPLTDDTRGILSAPLFAALPRGASVVNVGRGAHLVEADLLAALGTGHLAEAVIDVMHEEPLPAGHPFWAHPRVHVTPHIASETQIPTAVDALIANVRAHREGRPMTGLVDRAKGY
jgi:glyoxylate/hydroxypyruvate reductase A